MAQPPPPAVPVYSYASDVTVVHADESGLRLPHNSHPVPLADAPSGGVATPRPQSQSSSRNGPLSATIIPGYSAPTLSQPLSEPTPSPSHVQFAVHPQDEKLQSTNDIPDTSENEVSEPRVKQWVPMPLQTWFWLSLIVFMVLGGVILIVLLKITNDRDGWATAGAFSDTSNVLHYVYTIPPVAIAMFLVTMLVWTDVEIKKLQPYVDLVHGNSPPSRSLLLDYSRTNNFLVWMQAIRNKHFLVALATLMGLLALTFQPLAAALLTTKDTWWSPPDTTVKNQLALGLNWNPQFMDLTSFVTAAGYASASVLYNLEDPPFVSDPWTVGPFELPSYNGFNGTVLANTTAVKSEPNCRASENPTMTNNADGDGWVNTASANGCSKTWNVDNKTATTLFGSDIATCGGGYGEMPIQFRPVIFWFFTYQPSPKSSATFCFPTISFWDVTVKVDLATGKLKDVKPVRPFDSSYSSYSEYAGNLTGAPLNGRAYNGIEFDLTNPNRFILARRNATQLQMPAAVFQSAGQSPGGLDAAFNSNKFTDLATEVYTTYLMLIAKTVYFLPTSDPLTVSVTSATKRLFLSALAVYILAAVMFILAIALGLVQYLHRQDRRDLHLAHEPGTIASAVSIGAQTDMAYLLDGMNREKDLKGALRGKTFRIDPKTMKIVIQGEDGYEEARTPDPRSSVFGRLGLRARDSMRLSRPESGIPKSPISPNSPTAG